MSSTRIIAITAFMGMTLAACAGDPSSGGAGPKQNTGTLIGALGGALIGSQFGGGTGDRIAAGVAGAAIGGLIGNQIGASMDEEDKRQAYAAEIQALDGAPGAPVAWRNPNSGRYGSVVPGPAYEMAGAQCRQYTHTIYIDGQPQTARGSACRNPDGTWTPQG